MGSCLLGPECPTQEGEHCGVVGCENYVRPVCEQRANARQVGGTHYKTAYEHWDFATDVGMGHLEGSATKYIARWRDKGGAIDLEKALHYVEKLEEVAPKIARPLRDLPGHPYAIRGKAKEFARVNHLTDEETHLVVELAAWQHPDDLGGLADRIRQYIAQVRPPQPQEENNHARQLDEDEAVGIDQCCNVLRQIPSTQSRLRVIRFLHDKFKEA